MDDRHTIFASVILPLPVPKNYTYRVPFEWNEIIEIGHRVTVQFGPRKIYAGIVSDLGDEPPEGYQASYILEILDSEPVVLPSQLRFWQWIANYYMRHLGEAMAAALPADFRLQSESVISISPDFDEEQIDEMDEKEWMILKAVMERRKITVDEAAAMLNLKSPMKYIKSLYSRGFIVMLEEVQENYKPRKAAWVTLSEDWKNEDFARENLTLLEKKAPRQAAVILAVLGMGKGSIQRKLLTETHQISTSHISALEKKGLIQTEWREVSRLQKLSGESEFALTQAQLKAVKQIEQAFSSEKNALLFGATGSGKTFVYQHFIRKYLEKNMQVLYLVPEVGLTEQLVSRLGDFFGPVLGVWHSYYSAAERTELYMRIQSGEVKVLLGPRSALFAPFVALGLVVVDEEHESSFKQFDKRPHYHGRDAAIQLAAQWKAHVILGSATPSYEMMHAAENEKIHLVPLQERFLSARPPEIELVHTGEAKKQNRMKSVFSLRLLEGIELELRENRQVIVFQNRKGYVPYISCGFCGYTQHCVNCDIALTYYKSSNRQKCNYCGYTQDPLTQCPACGSTAMNMRGFGTERIAEELSIFFPEARITRFDQESIRKRSDFQKILSGFENRQIDILVGTQLLSKGLDFRNVGLVCIPDADLLLNIPDFRSHERAFQQMHQVAGRAGRGDKQGKVIIQTYQPAHPVIQAVLSSDFKDLAYNELSLRKELSYPPFVRLIRIVLRHKDAAIAREAAQYFAKLAGAALGERLLGPQEPPVAKIRNYYLQHMLVKIVTGKDSPSRLKEFLSDVALRIHKTPGFKGVWIDFDVDPV